MFGVVGIEERLAIVYDGGRETIDEDGRMLRCAGVVETVPAGERHVSGSIITATCGSLHLQRPFARSSGP
jgi:hypothetical protein